MSYNFHLPHMEDLILMGRGSELYTRLTQSNAVFPTVQMKLDGAPSIIIGSNDNGIFVGNKTGLKNSAYRVYGDGHHPTKLSPIVSQICRRIMYRLKCSGLPPHLQSYIKSGYILNGDVLTMNLPDTMIDKSNVVEYQFHVGRPADMVIGLHTMFNQLYQPMPIDSRPIDTIHPGITMLTNVLDSSLELSAESMSVIKELKIDAIIDNATDNQKVTLSNLLLRVPNRMLKCSVGNISVYEAVINNGVKFDVVECLVELLAESTNKRLNELKPRSQSTYGEALLQRRIELEDVIFHNQREVKELFNRWVNVSRIKPELMSTILQSSQRNLLVTPINMTNAFGEGLVLTDHIGSVKLIDRLDFSLSNFRHHGEINNQLLASGGT